MKTRALISFLTYPLTFAVVALIAAAHGFLAWWFRPTLVENLVVAGADLLLFGAWFVFCLNSEGFRLRFNRMPYEDGARKIMKALPACSPAFGKNARDCVHLIQSISAEFPENTYQADLEILISNLDALVDSNGDLYQRMSSFGSEEQKQRMKALLEKQESSMRNTLETLKTFSGNLTLLLADQQSTIDTSNIKYMNQGLSEVLEESKNE